MNSYRYNRAGLLALLGLLMPLNLPLLAERTAAQGFLQTVFEAPLSIRIDGQAIHKGTVLVTLDGQALRLFGAFDGLSVPWVQADLYRGDPADGGVLIENLAILIGHPTALGGGFDRTVTLTQADVDALNNGLLYVAVRMATGDPKDDLHGQIQLSATDEAGLMETPLSQIWLGQPVARGAVRAQRTPAGLRLIGYFHGLSSNWQQMALYRGAHGTPGEQVATIFSFPFVTTLYAGFNATLALYEGWEQDLLDGLLSVEIVTSRAGDGLRGRILQTLNQAPEASQILSPTDGETIVIGGTGGADPVDPNVLLGTVSFTPVADPDDNPVAYLWQASLRPDFSNSIQTITVDLGVDSTRFRLTVAGAAALFDTLSGRQPGNILLDTPVTLYHRVLTTDGSRYTLGEAVQATFIRGTITANESADDVPGAFTLHGNYPNPFNPTTTIVFDLPWRAEVRVEAFDLLGRQVLTHTPGTLNAGTMHSIKIDGSPLPSGTYLYRVSAKGEHGAKVTAGRMTLIK